MGGSQCVREGGVKKTTTTMTGRGKIGEEIPTRKSGDDGEEISRGRAGCMVFTIRIKSKEKVVSDTSNGTRLSGRWPKSSDFRQMQKWWGTFNIKSPQKRRRRKNQNEKCRTG